MHNTNILGSHTKGFMTQNLQYAQDLLQDNDPKAKAIAIDAIGQVLHILEGIAVSDTEPHPQELRKVINALSCKQAGSWDRMEKAQLEVAILTLNQYRNERIAEMGAEE